MAKLPTYDDLMKAQRSDLIALRNDLERAIRDNEAEARRTAMEEAKRIVEQAGFSVNDLFGNASASKGKKGDKAPTEFRYAHPENPSLKWSGRGRQPAWIKEHEEAGGNREDFAIKA